MANLSVCCDRHSSPAGRYFRSISIAMLWPTQVRGFVLAESPQRAETVRQTKTHRRPARDRSEGERRSQGRRHRPRLRTESTYSHPTQGGGTRMTAQHYRGREGRPGSAILETASFLSGSAVLFDREFKEHRRLPQRRLRLQGLRSDAYPSD